MNTRQIQIKISLSDQLNQLLQAKAAQLGLPVTQFVKHLIINDVKEEYPTYEASEWLEKETKKAMLDIDKAVEIKNIHEFFKNL